MDNERSLAGSWKGELVDILGFKGELALDLADGKDGLKGQYSVAIGGQHSSLVRRGEISGKAGRGKLQLVINMREPPVKMGLDADVIALRGGGTGLRGTYQVSARGFSPLKGGIVVLAKDRREEAQLVTRADRKQGGR